MNYQAEKQVVLKAYADIEAARPDQLAQALGRHVTDDYVWRGYHPFNELRGAKDVAQRFWRPFAESMAPLQRRMDVFMAGENAISDVGGVWVASMGHMMGFFRAPWLGIPPTGKIAMLRYAEFNRVENGRLAETAFFFDLPHLMMQAGLTPFPPQTGAHLVQPGPRPSDGVMLSRQDAPAGHATLSAIDRMIQDIGNWTHDLSLEEELRLSWHEDMIWWGPAGIGASYTIPGYAAQHARPFRAGFKDRKFNGHVAKIAEGQYGGFFGWPNLTLTPVGGFMGMPGSETPGDMRVIDIYRREGDKLAENWVFIDLPHFWLSQGLDILARMQAAPRT